VRQRAEEQRVPGSKEIIAQHHVLGPHPRQHPVAVGLDQGQVRVELGGARLLGQPRADLDREVGALGHLGHHLGRRRRGREPGVGHDRDFPAAAQD
jgi:hypothetical protein